ncbi:hypothetical protein SAMN05216299_1212 [Nitrosospira sp. Nsp14]|nr:hypothetical protein SAMN05216299_1212 [Nitrosospira sp. Nsp14]
MMRVAFLHSSFVKGLAIGTAVKHLTQLMVSRDERRLSTTLGCPKFSASANRSVRTDVVLYQIPWQGRVTVIRCRIIALGKRSTACLTWGALWSSWEK